MKEICNECGESVAFGSGKYVNRIPSFDNEETQKEMGKPYPKGKFMCQECELKMEKIYLMIEELLNY